MTRKVMFGLLVGVAVSLPAPGGAAQLEHSTGVWRNPQNSVHVRASSCGTGMCGTVIWANEKAKADARRGGTATLVGMQLFHDFHRESADHWRGKVFVPDIGKTFSGTVVFLDENTIVGSGCLFGRIACKSQTWSRLE